MADPLLMPFLVVGCADRVDWSTLCFIFGAFIFGLLIPRIDAGRLRAEIRNPSSISARSCCQSILWSLVFKLPLSNELSRRRRARFDRHCRDRQQVWRHVYWHLVARNQIPAGGSACDADERPRSDRTRHRHCWTPAGRGGSRTILEYGCHGGLDDGDDRNSAGANLPATLGSTGHGAGTDSLLAAMSRRGDLYRRHAGRAPGLRRPDAAPRGRVVPCRNRKTG